MLYKHHSIDTLTQAEQKLNDVVMPITVAILLIVIIIIFYKLIIISIHFFYYKISFNSIYKQAWITTPHICY